MCISKEENDEVSFGIQVCPFLASPGGTIVPEGGSFSSPAGAHLFPTGGYLELLGSGGEPAKSVVLDLLVLTAAGGNGKRLVNRFSLLVLKFQVWTRGGLLAVQTWVPGLGSPRSFI